MSRLRACLYYASLIIAALLVSGARGQGQVQSAARVILQTIGLPPVDRGLEVGEPRPPGSALTSLRRAPAVEGRATDRVGTGGARYVPGRVVVKFRGVSTTSRLSTLAGVSRSASMAPHPEHADFDIVNIDQSEDAEAVARALSQREDVEYAQAAYRVHPYFVPNDSQYNMQWNFPQIDLERAWDIQRGGSSSVIVAVIDSGIAFQDAVIQFRGFAFSSGGFSYPALGNVNVPFSRALDLAAAGSAGDSRFVTPHDFIWDDNDPLDLDGHGTHVAGTIGQLTNNGSGTAGVAFNVRLMPVKVISTDWDDIFHSPHVGTDDVVAQGIRYAADNGAKVLNLSIGRNGPSAPVIEDAIRYAVSKGCFVAIAGGNEFETGNFLEVMAEIASRVKGAVSVAAVDRSSHRAYYSTTGSYLEIAAPGGSIRASGTDGLVYQQTYLRDAVDTFNSSPAQFKAPRFDALTLYGAQGTSMATPHVSGLAALLMSQGLTDPAAIEAAMEQFACQAPLSPTTCTNRGAAGRDSELGFGEISARNTLRGLGLAR